MKWSEEGVRVAIHTEKALFTLQYHSELLEDGDHLPEENALFEVARQVDVASKEGFWYKEAYFYVAGSKLHRLLGDDDTTVCYMAPHRSIVRYLPSQDCLYCMDTRVRAVRGREV